MINLPRGKRDTVREREREKEMILISGVRLFFSVAFRFFLLKSTRRTRLREVFAPKASLRAEKDGRIILV